MLHDAGAFVICAHGKAIIGSHWTCRRFFFYRYQSKGGPESWMKENRSRKCELIMIQDFGLKSSKHPLKTPVSIEVLDCSIRSDQSNIFESRIACGCL